MKKLLVTLAAVLVSASAFAQGTVAFVNRTSVGDWKVALPGGAGAGSVAGITANLFLADANGNATGSSVANTTFRTSPAGAQVFLTEVDPEITGLAPGNTSQKFLAVFSGANLAASGNSVLLQFLSGSAAGGGSPPLPPGELVPSGAQASLLGGTFTLAVVPEPSTIALGVLGAAALLLRRRK